MWMAGEAKVIDPGDDPKSDVPVPRRYWWLRRLVAAGGCFGVFLVLLRLVWGWEANRRLAAEIERYRAAGQPVYAREFDAVLDAVPDEENAVLLYEKAIAGVVSASAAGLTIDDFYGPDGAKQFKESADDAREIIGSNRAVLALVREARDRPRVAWSPRLEGSAIAGPQMIGRGQRDLLKLLWMTSTQERLAGDHAAAFETLRDAIVMSDAIGSQPTLIANLVSGGAQGLAFTLIEDMSGGLYIEPLSQPSPRGARPTSNAAIRILVAELLDETETRAAAVNSRYGHRAYYLDLLDFIKRRGLGVAVTFRAGVRGKWDEAVGLINQPVYTLDILRAIKAATLGADALAATSWPSAEARIQLVESQKSLLKSISSPLFDNPFGDDRSWVHRSIELNFQSLAKRRMAATALAILLYEHDHGRRPAMLAELAPEYLPRVPVDPFSPDGAEIRYRAGTERPRLYCVGADGVDDGGMTWGEALERDIETSDIAFDLSGRSDRWLGDDPPSPSGEAVDHDQDPEDGEGEQDEEQASQGEPE